MVGFKLNHVSERDHSWWPHEVLKFIYTCPVLSFLYYGVNMIFLLNTAMDRCYRQRPWELSIYNQIKRKVKQCEKMVIRLKKWIHFWTDLFDCDAIVLFRLCMVWTLLSTRKHSFADACEGYRATSAKDAIGNLNQISQMFIECAFETVVCQMVSISCWFWCGQWRKLSDKPLTIVFIYYTGITICHQGVRRCPGRNSVKPSAGAVMTTK